MYLRIKNYHESDIIMCLNVDIKRDPIDPRLESLSSDGKVFALADTLKKFKRELRHAVKTAMRKLFETSLEAMNKGNSSYYEAFQGRRINRRPLFKDDPTDFRRYQPDVLPFPISKPLSEERDDGADYIYVRTAGRLARFEDAYYVLGCASDIEEISEAEAKSLTKLDEHQLWWEVLISLPLPSTK